MNQAMRLLCKLCLLAAFFVTGQVFDSSVKRGEPLEFKVGAGQVIEGWDIALMQMKKGEKRIIILPYYLA